MAANWKGRITILIGQTVPLTGQVAGAVKEMNEGAKAYIESVNRAGGVHGRKIEIRTLDDGFDPAGVPLVAPSTGAPSRLSGPPAAGSRMQVMTLSNNSSQSFVKNLGADGIGGLTREAFIRGLESMRKVDFGGLMVTYGPDNHTGSEFVELAMIGKDARFLR